MSMTARFGIASSSGVPHGHAGSEDKKLKPRMKADAIWPACCVGSLRGEAVVCVACGLEHLTGEAGDTSTAELDYVQAWLDERCEEAGRMDCQQCALRQLRELVQGQRINQKRFGADDGAQSKRIRDE
jgi:hypothetical protein